MSPRLFCNVVYAFLMRDADQEQRQEIDGELYTPIGHKGSDLSNLLRALDDAVAEDDGSSAAVSPDNSIE